MIRTKVDPLWFKRCCAFHLQFFHPNVDVNMLSAPLLQGRSPRQRTYFTRTVDLLDGTSFRLLGPADPSLLRWTFKDRGRG
ncbi:hypothetical protein GR257_37910 [Rhizobium leguminosarum]|uniref:Uncharacterized protein n=1 Tax=Rhizobium leguminosarum TaxID=384 RepID=A0A7K3VTJ3_RHILE|nr:hypothetical protein [Rhizobium leguminosarum]